MDWGIASLAVAAAALFSVRYAHHRWQENVERERFVLGMTEASTPHRLRPRDRERLERLRAPWWAVWTWVPERLRDVANGHRR